MSAFNVLVVDDSAVHRKLFELALSGESCRVHIATNVPGETPETQPHRN
jgi:CheY-like chemotaxis protein